MISKAAQFIHEALQNARSALCSVRRGDLSSSLIIVLVALAVAANLTLFKLVLAVTIRSLPYESADQLVLLWNRHKDVLALERGIVTPTQVSQWAGARSFSQIATAELWTDNRTSEVDLIVGDSVTRIHGAFTSPNFFDVLGVRAVLGRTFVQEDVSAPVAVLSHELWQERFGGRSDIIGRPILLAAGRGSARAPRSVTVVGVLPARVQFTYPEATQIWLPQGHRVHQLALLYWTIARLRPGVSLDQAQSEMTGIMAAEAAARPMDTFRANLTVRVEPMEHYVLGEFKPLLFSLWAAAIGSAAIALANITCLLAATTAERGPELDARYALGAAPWRLVRQVVTETSTLAVVGAIIGVCLAFAGQRFILQFLPPSANSARVVSGIPSLVPLTLASAAAAGMMAGCLVGLGVLRRYRVNQQFRLGDLRQYSAGLASGLILCQSLLVTTALTVAVGAVVTSARLQRTSPGFEPAGLIVAKVQLLSQKYSTPEQVDQYYDLMLQQLRSSSGVEAAATTTAFPFAGIGLVTRVPSPDRPTAGVVAYQHGVDAEYLSLVGIPLLRGTGISPYDVRDRRRVAVVSQNMATGLFGTTEVVGKQFRFDSDLFEIVGVVSDIKDRQLNEGSLPAYYVPRTLAPSNIGFIVVRVDGTQRNWEDVFRSAGRSVDPVQPLERVATARELISDTTREQMFASISVAIVASLAWIVAALGFFGLVSWDVRRRRLQTAVKLALGATKGRIVRTVMATSLYPVAAGAVLAVPAALVVANWNFQAAGLNVIVSGAAGFWIASSTVVLTSAFAAYIGAVAATRVDPAAIMSGRLRQR
jgi:predicted permease